jgi:hypothetical protein
MEGSGECNRRWLLVLAGNERADIKSRTDFFREGINHPVETPSPHPTTYYHHQHRHVHLQVFRWHPLRRRCARRRHWSVLPSSIVPRRRRLTRSLDGGAKRSSDGAGISLQRRDLLSCIEGCDINSYPPLIVICVEKCRVTNA